MLHLVLSTGITFFLSRWHGDEPQLLLLLLTKSFVSSNSDVDVDTQQARSPLGYFQGKGNSNFLNSFRTPSPGEDCVVCFSGYPAVHCPTLPRDPVFDAICFACSDEKCAVFHS